MGSDDFEIYPDVPQDAQTVDEEGRRLDVTIDGVVHKRLGPIHSDHRGDEEAIVVNFPTRAYDKSNPDKYRTDPHEGAIPSTSRCGTAEAQTATVGRPARAIATSSSEYSWSSSLPAK